MIISTDFGFEFGTNNLEEMEQNILDAMENICETSAKAWKLRPDLREAIMAHLITGHRLAGRDVQLFLQQCEVIHIWRQCSTREEAQVERFRGMHDPREGGEI